MENRLLYNCFILPCVNIVFLPILNMLKLCFLSTGKGGKNRRRGKNENEKEKRELVFKEDGQGEKALPMQD